jgi:phage terminase large subunit
LNDLARLDYNNYAWIWEGAYLENSDRQVLAGKYIVREFTPDPNSWDGPYFGADWGFAKDPTALVKCWVFDGCLFIEHEAYRVGVEIDDLPRFFEAVPESDTHVIRADNARPETISHMQRHGFPKLKACEKWKGSVEDGVAHLRGYAQIIIHPRCKNTAKEARLYSYKTDRLTGDILPIIRDENNHAMDAIRYALEPLIKCKNFGILNYYASEARK